jgi:micrococcal nuclease
MGDSCSSKVDGETNAPGINKCYTREELEAVSLNTVSEITYEFTEAKVIKVYDGDTMTIAAWYDGGFKKFSVRLYGVDCPEMRGLDKEKALDAREFVSDLCLDKIIRIEVLNNKKYNGKKLNEKFGRLLAKVWIDGQNLATLLYENGHAVKYYGGKKGV